MSTATDWRARVYVMPKAGVLDPAGKAVQESLHTLGYEEVGDVRLGKYIELALLKTSRDAATVRLTEMCDRLLANGVIEDYRFDLDEA